MGETDKTLRAPSARRAVTALLLLVGGFMTFLFAALAFSMVLVMPGSSGVIKMQGVGTALVAGMISWLLHRLGLQCWRGMDTSAAALTGADTKIDKVWISRPGRSLFGIWVAIACGAWAVILGFSFLLAPWGESERAWLNLRYLGFAVQYLATGCCSIWLGIRSLRNPDLHDLRLLSAVGGFWFGWFVAGSFPRAMFDLNVWLGFQIFVGVFAYNLMNWLLRRREEYFGEHRFFCLGRVAIWLLTVAYFDTLLRVRSVNELDRMWNPIFMVSAIAIYALAVKTVAQDRDFIRHPRMHELGVTAIAIGIQMLPELIRFLALDLWNVHHATFWFSALAVSGYVHFLLIKWLQSTADISKQDERATSATGGD